MDSSPLTFREESLRSALPEIKPLLLAHWTENASFRESVPLDPDWETYENLDAAGLLALITVRSNGALVGYHLGQINGHLHYRSTRFSFVDLYFLLPAYRTAANGIRLFTEYERVVCSRVAAAGQMILVQRARFKNNEELEAKNNLMKRLGYEPVEMGYMKRVKL